MTEEIHVLDLKPTGGSTIAVCSSLDEKDDVPEREDLHCEKRTSPLYDSHIQHRLITGFDTNIIDAGFDSSTFLDVEKGYNCYDRRSRRRSESNCEEDLPLLVPNRKLRRGHLHKKSYSLNSHKFMDPSNLLSREEIKQALLNAPGKTPFQDLSLKKERSSRHIRRYGNCSNSKNLSPKRKSIKSSHRKKNSACNNDRVVCSYGSLESFGTRHSDNSSVRYHPGIGPDEFDPRKELAYYASHYAPLTSVDKLLSHNTCPSRYHLLSGSIHTSDDLMLSDSPKINLKKKGTANQQESSTDSKLAVMLQSDQMIAEEISKSKGRRKRLSDHRIQLLLEEQIMIEKTKGENQQTAFRDIFFAITFFLQLSITVLSGFKYGPEAMIRNHLVISSHEIGDTNEVWMNYMYIIRFAALCGLFSSLLALISLSFLISMAENVIKYSLIISIWIAFVWGTLGVGFSPQSLVPLSGVVFLFLLIGYSIMVWDRIPFATVNLYVSLRGIQTNQGLFGVAFGLLLVTYCWCVWFSFVFLGLYDHFIHIKGSLDSTGVVFLIILCICSYWTYQVIKCVVVVTVAEILKQWWLYPDDTKYVFVELALKSLRESLTHKFGSICFGALFVGVVGILKQIMEVFRPRTKASSFLCFQECLFCIQDFLASCVDNVHDSFNQWAFVYIGMYGYPFLKAGKQANILFRGRGWTKIVNDDLYMYVLTILIVVIAGCTGLFGLMLEHFSEIESGITSFQKPGVTSFLIGFLTGLLLSNVLVAVVSGALNTMFCCFASNPMELRKNHEYLFEELRHVWKDSWPHSMV